MSTKRRSKRQKPQRAGSTGKLRITADALNVRRSATLRCPIVGSVRQGDVLDWLDSSKDDNWYKVRKGRLTGWCHHRFLAHDVAGAPEPLDKILRIAEKSAIAGYKWKGRGIAPRGYIKGMAVVYARLYCKLKSGAAAVNEMAKANTGNQERDALAWYASKFNDFGMSNEAAGVNTLRHLFVLLVGLGMRESSGRYCEGRDRTAKNTSADSAEAGLFQTSFDARSASRFMPELFKQYSSNPTGFLAIFREGVTSKPKDLENFGTGSGKEFQRLTKECPAFAVEFAAVGLRNIRRHWGPINRREAEVRPEANLMLVQIEHAVDTANLCRAVL